jgi:serine-type D-Ala-D-Ala carboxypeptidase/endopeptidase (penicillin-binding protein 4)
MKRLWLGYFFFIGLCFADFKTFEFHDQLDDLLSSPLYKNVRVGISIENLSKEDAYKSVFKKNESDYFVPASMMKVLLSATTLSYFHPLDKFETPLYINGFISNQILFGDLIIRGIGDPSLKSKHLIQIVAAIRSLGISKIEGDLLYDNSFIKTTNYSLSTARYYNAPSSALNINNNLIKLRINKEKTGLEITETCSYSNLIDHSKVQFSGKYSGFPKLTVRQYELGDTYTVSGIVTNKDQANHNLECVITRPSLYVTKLLYELFQSEGVMITGEVKKSLVTNESVLIGIIKGDSVTNIVFELNQESNNMIANSLCKALGGKIQGAPGTTQKGIEVIKQFCEYKLMLPNQSLYLDDASGLSMNNKLTPFQFSRLFEYIYRTPNLGIFIIDSLVKQGDHNLHKQPKPPSKLQVNLKTGTLTQKGINTVGGYMYDTNNKEMYTFVIMTEAKKSSPKAYTGTFTNPIMKLMFESVE